MSRHQSLGLSRRSLLRAPAALGLAAAASPLSAAAASGGGRRPTEFWFIRHAESFVNVAPQPDVPDEGVTYPLTELGIRQARARAASLDDVRLTELYTSTRLRCIQTADAIGFRKRTVLRLAPAAVEIDLGDALSGPDVLAKLQRLLGAWQSGRYGARLPGGESLADLRDRFRPFVQEVVARHRDDGGVVVIVAHGGIIAWPMPFIASNVSFRFALDLANGLPNTGIVKAVPRGGRLFVTDWVGRRPA